MKVRLTESSLRFRLNPEDLAKLKENGTLQMNLALTPEQSIVFSLVLQGSVSVLHLAGASLLFCAPEAELLAWMDSKDLSWEYTQVHPSLTVWVEKDAKPHRN